MKEKVTKKYIITTVNKPNCNSADNYPDEGHDDLREQMGNCDYRSYEPPKLTLGQKIHLAQILQEKDNLELTVNKFDRRLESIRVDLKNIKKEIDVLSVEQESLQTTINASNDEEERMIISMEKVEKHKKLTALINLEDSLLNEVETTRRMLSTVNINQQSFALEMNEKIDQLYRMHMIRKDFEYGCRVQRENAITHNAKIVERRQVTACYVAVQEYCGAKAALLITKPKPTKATLEKLQTFRDKTFSQIAAAKSLAAAEVKSRQKQQRRNLVTLKQEIDEQRELLIAENQIRKERSEAKNKELQKRREEILATGGNLFVLERLEKKEKMERLVEQKRQDFEERTMKRLEGALNQTQKSEMSRRKLRQELEGLWATKTREKRRLAMLQEREYMEDIEIGSMDRYKLGLELTLGIQRKEIKNDPFNFDLFLAENSVKDSDSMSTPPKQLEVEVPKNENSESLGYTDDEEQHVNQFEFKYFKILPEKVVFKDFDIGKTYRKKVTVSNRSNQRLRFYLREFIDLNPPKLDEPGEVRVIEVPPDELSLEDEIPAEAFLKVARKEPITNVVKVNFEVPAPIFRGLSHEFYLTFSPKTNDDWEGELHFDSPVGPFVIVVKCCQKRFKPTINEKWVGFFYVICGTTATKEVKLTNKGSLSGCVSFIKQIQDLGFYNIHPVKGSVNTSQKIEDTLNSNESEPTVDGNGSSTETSGVNIVKTSKKKKKKGGKKKMSSLIENDVDNVPIVTGIDNLVKEIVDHPVVNDKIFEVTIKESTTQLSLNGVLTLKVKFSPSVPGIHYTTYEIGFDDLAIPGLQLELHGDAVENPYIAEPLNTNMKTCIMNVNYQEPVEIRTIGTGKIISKVPVMLKPFVEVSPKSVKSYFGQSTLFSVKFNPRSDLLNQPNITQVYDPETKILDFPITFALESFNFPTPGPLVCTFQAILEDPVLKFYPITIDFGICSTTETVQKNLTLTNTSTTQQHFGFVDMPDWMIVQPNFGFGTLLPGEKRVLDVLASLPTNMVGKQQLTLKLRTLEKKDYSLPVKAIGKIPTTALTHSHISFPVTCIGSYSSAVTQVYIKGTQSKSRTYLGQGSRTRPTGAIGSIQQITKFEFLEDSKFPIEITPNCGTIQPGKGQRILVTFAPDLTDDEVRSHFPNFLTKQFEENLTNIQMELTTINEMIITATPTNSGRGGSGDAKLINRNSHWKVSNDKKKSQVKPNLNQQKSIKQLTNLSSQKLFKSQIIVKTFDDLALIFSDGKVPVSINQIPELELRKKFLKRALDAKLDPAPLVSNSRGNLDFTKTRRDLIKTIEPQSSTYTLPCRMTLASGKTEMLILTLKCPMQKPDMILLESSTLTFGSVPVGKSLIREVNFYNTSIGVLSLKMDEVNPYGPFLRVNALRRLAPNLVFTLRLKFSPLQEGEFEETLKIYGGESQILVSLNGEGISPATGRGSRI